jgi:hypothetical protein
MSSARANERANEKGQTKMIEKQELDRIQKENLRLYSKIVKMSHSPQFGYLGLNKTGLNNKEKAIEAGLFLTKTLKENPKDPR